MSLRSPTTAPHPTSPQAPPLYSKDLWLCPGGYLTCPSSSESRIQSSRTPRAPKLTLTKCKPSAKPKEEDEEASPPSDLLLLLESEKILIQGLRRQIQGCTQVTGSDQHPHTSSMGLSPRASRLGEASTQPRTLSLGELTAPWNWHRPVHPTPNSALPSSRRPCDASATGPHQALGRGLRKGGVGGRRRALLSTSWVPGPATTPHLPRDHFREGTEVAEITQTSQE